MGLKTSRLLIGSIIFASAVSCPVQGMRLTGRFSFGIYESQERFANSLATGSNKNDARTVSARLYIRADEIGASRYEVVTDFRDKHDFFDKLNRERLSLTDRNEFQLRQASVRLPLTAQRVIGGQVGRFPVTDAGAAFVDGGKVDFGSKSLRGGVFGGLNPRQEGRSYLKYDSKASILGVTAVFDGKGRGWSKNFYLAHAFVDQTNSGHLDRRYIFHNLIYQWAMDSRLMTLIYYDLVPRTYVQSGLALWQQRWSRSWESELSHLSIDVIEYSRRQGVLERLPASAYTENGIKITTRDSDRKWRIQFRADDGHRSSDGLRKQTLEAGVILSRMLGPNWDFYGSIGQRKNFTSDDLFVRLGLGFYSRSIEVNLDSIVEARNNRENVAGERRSSTHPIVIDGTMAYYLSRKTYVATSLQHARDEDVTIWSGFLRLGYRFGDREIPPVRDGAPPRGAL